MLILSPRSVWFDGQRWDDVTLVAIDRVAARAVLEWSDAGRHAVFADVPEEKVTIRIARRVHAGSPAAGENGLRCGAEGELVLISAAEESVAARRRVKCRGVVVRVSHELSEKSGCVRVVEIAALSADGAADPLVITELDGLSDEEADDAAGGGA